MNKQWEIKDRWGMLIAFLMIPLFGTFGTIVFFLAGALALIHLARNYQKPTIKKGV